MDITTIAWVDNQVKIIDQTKLPFKFVHLYIKDINSMVHAIKLLKVRGAPALGAAAALGVYLGVRNSKAKTFAEFAKDLNSACGYIASSRPTARNLFWGVERSAKAVLANPGGTIKQLKRAILEEALAIIEEDRVSCRKIGEYGARLIMNNDSILTICNAGILATIDYGTALGVIYRAKADGKKIKVYSSETRPLLQGARLTTWELMQKGIDTTLICDNMAATLMKQGKIDKIIAGADRIATNGDTANKIGTYSLAVLANYHKIPFYIAAPKSTFDLTISNGRDIVIEERSKEEITELFFKKRVAHNKIKVYNPAFDVTDNSLISAFITDKGVFKRPFNNLVKKLK